MAAVVFILCMFTSLVCAVLLARSYRETRSRLLFWSAACFGMLAVNNAVLFLDLIVIRDVELNMVRSVTVLLALGLLAFGLIWESR
jgi:hypothetical protein